MALRISLRRLQALVSKQTTGSVVTIRLERPDVKNAFNSEVIAQVTEHFLAIGKENDPTRCVILTGAGDAFSAGADLNWMRAMKNYPLEEQKVDATALFNMFDAIAKCPVPVIARVNGHAMGGGVGLIAAADVSFGVSSALFGLTEVNLGLIPSAISPFVFRRIGTTPALRYFTSGERFGADEAARIGLLSAPPVADEAALDAAVAKTVKAYTNAAPNAVREAKKLAHLYVPIPKDVAGEPLGAHLASWIARLRVGDEAQEGMGSFLEKRKPSWLPAK